MTAVVIKRVVKKANLPRFLRVLQLLLKPIQLNRIHVIAVQRKESNITFLEGVITLAAHIKWLIKLFVIGVIMISQRGIKFHACIEKGLVRLFELLYEILW